MPAYEAIAITEWNFPHYEILARYHGFAHMFQRWANPNGFNHHNYIVIERREDGTEKIEFMYEKHFHERFAFVDLRPSDRSYSVVFPR